MKTKNKERLFNDENTVVVNVVLSRITSTRITSLTAITSGSARF